MSERRVDDRIPVDSNIDVIDLATERRVGVLANISLHGFMLLCNSRCNEERLYQLRIRVPQQGGGHREIDVGAESHWCQPLGEGGTSWVGFSIFDINDEDARFVERLIAQWAEA